ncbi:hypothetical protein SAMN05444276_102688 [Paracoccus sanguinis]|uniref:Uncharacterized protein n=1 Tax=Paracoccus sanguinis TaxID=1545044 RepID=A0A1H2Y1I5_9RHOB|nr:hypothetical protein SAMN05444276_102688 [Paracoccus sanguinis]
MDVGPLDSVVGALRSGQRLDDRQHRRKTGTVRAGRHRRGIGMGRLRSAFAGARPGERGGDQGVGAKAERAGVALRGIERSQAPGGAEGRSHPAGWRGVSVAPAGAVGVWRGCQGRICETRSSRRVGAAGGCCQPGRFGHAGGGGLDRLGEGRGERRGAGWRERWGAGPTGRAHGLVRGRRRQRSHGRGRRWLSDNRRFAQSCCRCGSGRVGQWRNVRCCAGQGCAAPWIDGRYGNRRRPERRCRREGGRDGVCCGGRNCDGRCGVRRGCVWPCFTGRCEMRRRRRSGKRSGRERRCGEGGLGHGSYRGGRCSVGCRGVAGLRQGRTSERRCPVGHSGGW